MKDALEAARSALEENYGVTLTAEEAAAVINRYLDALDPDALVEPLLDDEVVTAQDAVLTLLAQVRP